MGQSSSSLVLSAIKTEVLLDSDDPAYQIFLLQRYGERIEKLSQQDKLSKFCTDAHFLSVVESGQYFMTRDTADLSQFHAVACSAYTLPREEPASQFAAQKFRCMRTNAFLSGAPSNSSNAQQPLTSANAPLARFLIVNMSTPIGWRLSRDMCVHDL